MKRRFFTLISVLALAGCGTAGSLQSPSPVVLLDPEPGKALIYVFGSPRLVLSVNSSRVAVLPKDAVVTVGLTPGRHELLLADPASMVRAASITVDLAPGQRRFFESSIPPQELETRDIQTPGSSVSMVLPSRIPNPGRQWKEIREFDAREKLATRTPLSVR